MGRTMTKGKNTKARRTGAKDLRLLAPSVRSWLETVDKAGADTCEAAGILLHLAELAAHKRRGPQETDAEYHYNQEAEALEALDRAIYLAERINRHGCDASHDARAAAALLDRITRGIWGDDANAAPQ
jgi:hypothetical protein